MKKAKWERKFGLYDKDEATRKWLASHKQKKAIIKKYGSYEHYVEFNKATSKDIWRQLKEQ